MNQNHPSNGELPFLQGLQLENGKVVIFELGWLKVSEYNVLLLASPLIEHDVSMLLSLQRNLRMCI